MEHVRITNTPYDDVFRTLINDCSPLIIPLINEVFGEHYLGQEKITFSPNEHFLNQQGGNEAGRITDTSFKIEGKVTKKYHLECQSSTDSSMLVRFFEYGTQIALDEGHIAAKYNSVKEGVEAIMGGKVLEYEAKTIMREGIEQGIEQGEDKLSRLITKLMENGRPQDIIRVTQDREYRNQLYEEYFII